MIYNLCIIGGGINGVGIARDAAGRGLKVLLLEKGDLASCTSSNSSKMIHGGLRYLEFFEFGLVRKSLAERETLLKIAPQIVRPLRFCIPHHAGQVRPVWMVRIGLWIYDHLSRMEILPKSQTIHLKGTPYGEPLADSSGVGFLYSDCWVDDARLVVLNAMDAARRGADIRVQTKVTSLQPHQGQWTIGTTKGNFAARMVINAAGPYARNLLEENNLLSSETPKLRLVQGSHIAVPRLYDSDHAYLIQCPDKRVVFIWPYEGKYSLIGTTETEFHGDPAQARITDAEKDYLCQVIQREFRQKISPKDIVWDYCGVRPLFDAGQEQDTRKVTRDYRLILDDHQGAKILNVFGGKITTYRPLAEEVVDKIAPILGVSAGSWTGHEKLPDIGMAVTPDDDQAIRYFIRHEWARDAEDILWRRTKWGLHLSPSEQQAFKDRFTKILTEEIGHDQDSGD